MSRILIVEDESHLAQGLLFNLEAEGHEASVVETGEGALESLAASDFDLIVLDVMLPGVSGLKWQRNFGTAEIMFPCSC